MKHNRLVWAVLLTAALSVATMTACDKGTPEDTTAADSTPVTGEVTTEAATDAPAEKVEVTLTVKDQDGNPVTDVTVSILPESGEGESATLTADGEGSMKVSLPAGQYVVRFDVLPEYVLGIDTPINVTAGMESVALEVTNNTPNGSVERPFFINEDVTTITVPAGTTYNFTLFGGYNRTLTLTDAGAEIVFNAETYTPNENGEIAVPIVTESPRDHAYFALTNKSGEAREITLTVMSAPGSMDNPIAIAALGEAVTANVPQDGMLYYRWTATAAGTLTVSSADTINNISLNNLNTSQVSDFTAGGESVSLNVSEGDVITVIVSVIGGDKQAETQPVTFTLSMGE